jgi:hypothetical protein
VWNNRILRAAFWASIDRELHRIAFILGCSPQSFTLVRVIKPSARSAPGAGSRNAPRLPGRSISGSTPDRCRT